MYNNRKVVVTMTSWTRRIGNCHQVVQSILDGSVKPDLVFLNLSIEEFPKREAELPIDLLLLSKTHPEFKIYWVPGPNVKTMKKVFPILPFLDDDDIIIIVDDDLILPRDLVELRLREFGEHGERFAISAGTNPKWHVNKRIYDTRFNMITPTSLFTKRMLGEYNRILSREIIDTYNDDFTYTLLLLVNGYIAIPSRYLSSRAGTTQRVVKNFNEVGSLRVTKGYSSDDKLLSIFEKRWKEVSGHELNESLFNIVIYDSFDKAGDNGEYLYRKIREQYPFIQMTFLLSERSRDWDRLKKDGFNLYPFQGRDVETLMDRAVFILFSKDIPGNRTFARYRYKTVFLDHGVFSSIYDCSFYVKGSIVRLAKYVCCSSEYEPRFLKNCSQSIIPLNVGAPRHDTLLQKYNERKQLGDKRKTIFISFHWRRGDLDHVKPHFMASLYRHDIERFLNSQKLRELADSGVTVYFLPHARFLKYLNLFNPPDFVKIPVGVPFQDILVESDLLITDFSSNCFEMAYMDKPSVIYVPGIEEVRRTMPQYHMENFGHYENLTYCKSIDDALDAAKSLLDKEFDFSKRLFMHVDTDNSKRLVEWMIENRPLNA